MSTRSVAVVLMAYGTPGSPEEIEPYYTDIRRGRPPTKEALDDLVARYAAIGGVSPLANGMATAADWMSAASFISMAGLISFMGYDGSVYLMGWTGGYVLLALLLAPYLRKYGAFTVPDFVGDRYYSQAARIVAVICAIFVSFTYVAGQMRGVGIVFSGSWRWTSPPAS